MPLPPAPSLASGLPGSARPGPGPGGDDAVVDHLERALTLVGRAILRLGVPAHALAEGEHVDRSGYWVLHRLDECAATVRLSDLAVLLELDLSTVSRQVRQLVEGGLVTREPDPGDGRACLLALSARGRAVLDAVRQSRREVLHQALRGWSPAQRAAITSALVRLADDLPPATHGAPGPGRGEGRPGAGS